MPRQWCALTVGFYDDGPDIDIDAHDMDERSLSAVLFDAKVERA